MNILFFLTPKAMCSHVEAGCTIRQAMERMENSGFSAMPVLDRDCHYLSVITEGDILWTLKRLGITDWKQAEEYSISEVIPHKTVQAITVNTPVESLFRLAAGQNFVPVIDDRGFFIGIVTRRRIMQYFIEKEFPAV